MKKLRLLKPLKSLTTKKQELVVNNQRKNDSSSYWWRSKRKYRLIDFKRNKLDVPGRVATIEYDPNRSANIALFIIKMEKRDTLLLQKI